MPAHHAFALLRAGAHLHAQLDEPGAPSPLDLAQVPATYYLLLTAYYLRLTTCYLLEPGAPSPRDLAQA